MMEKTLIAVIIFLSFTINLSAQNSSKDTEIKKELIGVWQASPVVASGMNDNFQFFADGKYKFNYNQMNGEKRIFSHAGKWKIENGKLIITLETLKFLIGGKTEKATGSTATDFDITGGNVLEKKILPAEKIELSLDNFIKEELHNTTKIDGVKYWKLSSDPTTYEN